MNLIFETSVSRHQYFPPPFDELQFAVLAGWLSALSNGKKLLVQAAALAQSVTDYILSEKKSVDPLEENPNGDTASRVREFGDYFLGFSASQN